MVLGASDDGGYYLIGLKQAASRNCLSASTGAPNASFGRPWIGPRRSALPSELLPTWYDVDDAATLERLRQELALASGGGFEARHTRAYLERSEDRAEKMIGRDTQAERCAYKLSAQPWVTNTALVLLGLALVALPPGRAEIHHFVIGFGWVAMDQALLYLVAVWVVLNRPANRWTFAIILVSALGAG